MAGGDGDAEGPEAALAALREQLRDAMDRRGLTRKDIVARSTVAGTPLGPTTISRALNPGNPPPSWRTVRTIAQVLGADQGRLRLRELWQGTRIPPDAPPPPTPLPPSARPGTVDAASPGLLEVQEAPFLPTDTGPGDTGSADTDTTTGAAEAAFPAHPALTPYVPRPHDEELSRLLGPALDGATSTLAVLTGHSSTGKTRALFEALHQLAPSRPLWRPADAAALADLLAAGRIGPGTVLWLNEAQRFLYGDRSEEAAAALRELLMTSTGIVAVATLWTNPYWDDLIRPALQADPHSHVRALLESPVTHRIQVPVELTPAERSHWERLAESSRDPRMAPALRAGAADGRVVQHLSGGPRLLAAYRMGPGAHFTPAEHALVTAAVTARQLGHHPPLSEDLLTRAADADLSSRLRPAEADWARAALAALATGVRRDGIRTDIRNSLTALVAVRATSGGPAAYEPADYLHQSLLATQELPDPTPALWRVLTDCTTDAYALNRLSMEAQRRDFLKQAVLLLRRAAVAGYPEAWKNLVLITPQEAGDRHAMALWMADHVGLGSASGAMARLWELRTEGPQVTARLAARVVARTDLTDADEVRELLGLLDELGHGDMLLALSPEAHVSLSDEIGVLQLLTHLLDSGCPVPAARLADRILSRGAVPGTAWANHVVLRALRVCAHRPADLESLSLEAADRTDPADLRSALGLLQEFREAGQERAALRFADRLVDTAEPDDTAAVASLLYELRCLDMYSACRRLAERAVPVAELEDPEAVGWLLDELGYAGLGEAVDALLARDPVAAVVAGPVTATVLLLWSLRSLGRKELVHRLIVNSLPYVEPDDAEYASCFLDLIAQFGAAQDLARFARRAAEEAPLTRTAALGFLARSLHRHHQAGPLDRLARRAIADADPRAVASFLGLLRTFRSLDLDAHAHALIERASGHPALSAAVTRHDLLNQLRGAGESGTARLLEGAAPPAVGSTDAAPAPAPAVAVARTWRAYGLETDGTPAGPWSWSDLTPRTSFSSRLRHQGASPLSAPGPWPSWERYADN
ncbi:hypothetical protein [Streptomyces sp. NPDC058401]|uniref:hypothetical protein n=1 Tax=Streptomyces sp. NPDC058401 TaxID=3346480 RepID=UPI00365B07DD